MITNKEKNFISAVVYINNNEDTVEYFLEQVNDILSKNFEKYEVIFVNDASTDKSVEKIRTVTDKLENSVVSIINMSYYQGLEMSMNAGVDLAIGDFIYEFDSVYVDYEMTTIMEVYNQSKKGFDIVSAVSNARKHWTSKLFYTLFNNYSNSTYKIKAETFRVLSRRAINRIQSMNKTIPYRKAIYSNCGLKLDFVAYKTKQNNKFKSTKQIKINKKNLAIDSLIIFTDFAYKISIFTIMILLLAIVVVIIYTMSIFVKGAPIAGWTTTMLFLALAFFGVFTFLAVVIKYLSIIMNLIFKRQKYMIESIEKINK